MSNLATILANLPDAERRTALAALSPDELTALEYEWSVWGRPDQQIPEGDWFGWVILAGRGWGKTETGCQAIRRLVETGKHRRLCICGPTAGAVRRDIIEGPSGILETARPDFRPTYEPSSMRVVWPNGAVASLLSMEEPERARGLNVSAAYLDEFAAGATPQAMLDMVLLGLRVNGPTGDSPRLIVTTTPKPVPALRSLIAPDAIASGRIVLTRGRTMDNAANLAPSALAMLHAKYDGTRLGRQELNGEMLTDMPGALWTHDLIESARRPEAPDMRRVVIGVDPAGGSTRKNDETGIVGVGVAADKHLYVLADNSGRYSPDGWARRAVQMYDDLKADCICVETNFGGEMAIATIKAIGSGVRVKAVTASRGKMIRAEPIASLYEQGKVHHIGMLAQLEDQMCDWSPTESTSSPDRLDALVWACTELSGGRGPIIFSDADLGLISDPRTGGRGIYNTSASSPFGSRW